jgi:hypothetical protein
MLRVISALVVVGVCSASRAEPLPVIASVPSRVPVPKLQRLEAMSDGLMCEGYPGVVDVDPILPSRLGVLLEEPVTERERIEVERQISRCARDVGAVADPWLVLALWRLEEELGVPEEARGILGATWCWESAMRRNPRSGDVGRSHGPLQMQDWFWSWCGGRGQTQDLLDAATCFWSRVEDRYRAKAMRCQPHVRWRVAESLTANGPKYARFGCKAESAHWRELMRWR